VRLRDLLHDAWAPFSHKEAFARPGGEVRDGASWVQPESRRRLLAYQMLKAYDDNVARAFLSGDADQEDDRREYGEPGLIVRQTVSAVMGESQAITVQGASDYDPDLPSDATPDELAANAVAEAAVAEQDALRAWADRERLPLKMLECERNASLLGDGVYLLAWSGRKQRPTLTVVDPGFYFPVLPEGLADDYPERVHLAWELPPREPGGPQRLRRVTYELGPIEPARDATPDDTRDGRLRRLTRTVVDAVTGSASTVLLDGDSFDADGRIVRRYPWQPLDEDTSGVTCYLTEAEWDLHDVDHAATVDTLTPERARYLTNGDGELLDRLDLRIDFVPVVHVPNTVPGSEHYGRSSLASVLQLLDEISSTDTDESAASATTGSPPIMLSGAEAPKDVDGRPAVLTVAPGEVWFTGVDGRMDQLDTSPNLKALAERQERLLKRLSVNSRLPDAVLGRERNSGQAQESGYHLLLSFGPLKALVAEARLARQEKYPLLLKFAQRLYLAGKGKPAGSVPPRAELEFGAFLPTDVDAEIARLLGLYGAQALSLETLLAELQGLGVPIPDVGAEVGRIQSRQFEQANALADATGDTALVRDFLGLPAAVPLPLTAPAGASTVPTEEDA